jgi:hypothetical protein
MHRVILAIAVVATAFVAGCVLGATRSSPRDASTPRHSNEAELNQARAEVSQAGADVKEMEVALKKTARDLAVANARSELVKLENATLEKQVVAALSILEENSKNCEDIIRAGKSDTGLAYKIAVVNADLVNRRTTVLVEARHKFRAETDRAYAEFEAGIRKVK